MDLPRFHGGELVQSDTERAISLAWESFLGFWTSVSPYDISKFLAKQKNFSLIQNSNDRQWCFWNAGVGYLPHSIFLTECFMERREELMGWPSGYPKWLTQDASGVYCMQNTHARNNTYFKEDSYLGQQAWSLDRHWGPVAKVITEVGMSAWGVIWWAGKPERFRVHPGCCIMSCFCEN